MANDLNRCIFVGRLTRDPEIRYTPSGTAVASFSIANGRTFQQTGEKKEQVNYFDCIAWSKLGEIITEHCKKGQMLAIEGHLQQSRWDDQDGKKRSKVEIIVDTFQFLGGKKAEEGNEGLGKEVDLPAVDNPFSDDDVPF